MPRTFIFLIPRIDSITLYFGLIYDPLKSLHYKVVAFVIRRKSSSVDDLHIYSSETGTWKASIQSFIRPPLKIFPDGVYWNVGIYWLSICDCFYFDMDKERLGTFPRPPLDARTGGRALYFGESENHLHVVDILHGDTSLSVYEMKSDYSEWFVKYQIDFDPISKVFPQMIDSYYKVAVLSLIRREKFQEDSFLVLEIPGKVIRYNLVDRSSKLIWDLGVTLNIESFMCWLSARFQVCQYSESVSCAELQLPLQHYKQMSFSSLVQLTQNCIRKPSLLS